MFEGIKHRLFYEDNGEWYVGETKKEVSVEELPARIREKLRQQDEKLRQQDEIRIIDADEMELLLNDKDAINFCPHCGAKVKTANAKFCVKCGKSLVDD